MTLVIFNSMESSLRLQVKAIFPLELRLLDQQSIRPWIQEANIFANESLCVIVNGATPISTFRRWTCEYWLWEKEHQILDAN